MYSLEVILTASFALAVSSRPQGVRPSGAPSGATPNAAPPASIASTTSASQIASSQTSIETSSSSLASSAAPVKAAQTAAANADGAATGSTTYTRFNGDGSSGAGWPTDDKWISFTEAFDNNQADMQKSCTQYGQPNDSPDEITDIKNGVTAIASTTGVDERFIFAVIMQESTGCVRAATTNNTPPNPGLMQSHGGISCFGITPCPTNQIKQMIQDGAGGVNGDVGLQQGLGNATASETAQNTYQAARIYNSGSMDASGDLAAKAATPCYCSDIANRLIGFVGESPCT